jgi:hypothetical protein
LGRAILPDHRYASTGTTDTRHTRVRLTVTTDLAGSQADCLSAPAPGITDIGVAADGALVGAMDAVVGVTDVAAGVTDAALSADAALHGVRSAASTVPLAVDFTVRQVEVSTVRQVEDSTVAGVGSMVVVAADAGNGRLIEFV